MAWTSSKTSVLVPYDFSPAANAAIEAALSFVADASHVAVLNVIEPVSTFVTLSEEKNRMAQESLDDSLVKLRSALDEAGYGAVTGHVRLGVASECIAEYVEKHSPELVVMPSARRRGVKRLLLGSVTEAVLRHVPCPVLVLRADEE